MKDPADSTIRFREVARQLRQEVMSGAYGQEGRMPSEAQLVQRFGVSRPTVAKALSVLASEGLVERRAGSGTFAKGERRAATSSLLALLVPSLGNTEIFQLICGEIASLARVHNHGLVWGGSEQPRLDPELSLQHSRELCKQ